MGRMVRLDRFDATLFALRARHEELIGKSVLYEPIHASIKHAALRRVMEYAQGVLDIAQYKLIVGRIPKHVHDSGTQLLNVLRKGGTNVVPFTAILLKVARSIVN